MKNIEFKIYEDFPSNDVLSWTATLNQEIFQFGETEQHLSEFLQNRTKILICLAFHDGQPIGYKIGFQERTYYFESWRGGVLPKYRGNGIAQHLLTLQHDWCTEKGFRIVTTITSNNNTAMLIVNLRNGFEIVGTSFDRRSVVKVFLQKWLVEPPE